MTGYRRHGCRWLCAERADGAERYCIKPGKAMPSYWAPGVCDSLRRVSASVGAAGWSTVVCCCRKEWRRRTTTLTWRWPVRMARWSSSKSKDILHSTNSWRRTVKDRYAPASKQPFPPVAAAEQPAAAAIALHIYCMCNLNKRLLSFLRACRCVK